jgi:iron(III) transport system ATP-binding protein
MRQIKIENIHKSYKQSGSELKILDGINITISSGEFFFLLGPSGCGKTTLLRIICGLLDPTSGRIFFDDKDVTQESVQTRDTAMVFQNYALWPHMTVQKNTEFGLEMKGVDSKQRSKEALENLKMVQMAEYAARKPNQLSGGQQQRVALARAIASRPQCLLLDEPLSNLDAKLRLQMRGELRRLVKSSGITGIYVTHDQKEALSMADRIAIMHRGTVEQVASPVEMYERPHTSFVADFVGEANFLEGKTTKEGGCVAVNTSVGTISAQMNDFFTDGTVSKCCIRPEKIAMAPQNQAAPLGYENKLPASIISRTYLGESIQYETALKDGQKWRVSVPGSMKFPEEKEICLYFKTNDVVLLRE